MAFDWFRKKADFGSLGFTADCHCHLLPGVDDGSRSAGESFAILKEMLRAGITSVVLTPHINPEIYPSNTEQFIRERYDEFIAALPEDLRQSVSISLGAEYMVTGGFDEREPSELIQFQSGKVLIEMSYFYGSPNMEQAIFSIASAGLTPVIAHPERYLYLTDSPGTFERYHDMGAEFQMNLLSLSGVYGPESLRILKYIRRQGWYAYVATDAHNLSTVRRITSMKFDRSLVQ